MAWTVFPIPFFVRSACWLPLSFSFRRHVISISRRSTFVYGSEGGGSRCHHHRYDPASRSPTQGKAKGSDAAAPSTTSPIRRTVTVHSTLDFDWYSDYFSEVFTGMAGTSSDFCFSQQMETLTTYNATATITTRGTMWNSVNTTYTLAHPYYKVTAIEPCCSTCSFGAAHASVIFWPTPAIPGQATSVVTNGQT